MEVRATGYGAALPGSMTGLAGRAARALLGRLSDSVLRLLPRPLPFRVRGLAHPPAPVPAGGVHDAAVLYQGRFSFAGRTVECDGRVIFDHDVSDAAWLRELHGFGWLRTLLDSERRLMTVFARTLVGDWQERSARLPSEAMEPAIAARRLMHWIAAAPTLVGGAPGGFEQAFFRSLAWQTRRLARMSRRRMLPHERMLTALALTHAAVGLAGLESLRGQALSRLAEELEWQILPDGGHVSRSPAVLLEIIAFLLPLRDAVAQARLPLPEGISGALERALPMLRFFRHGDGGLALLGGVADPAPGLLTAVLEADPVAGRPLSRAPHSGYLRMQQGAGLVIVDGGPALAPGIHPDAPLSVAAFEFSHGPFRIVTSCGAPRIPQPDWRTAARLTAAHSTMSVNGHDAGRILSGRIVEALFGTPVLTGPADVRADCREAPGGSLAEVEHDGFARCCGLRHGRRLFLMPDGVELRGEDTLLPAGGSVSEGGVFTLRFHLHPSVRATLSRDGSSIMLTLPDRSGWKFSARGGRLRLEESVLLASGRGLRRTVQIVVEGDVAREGARVNWFLKRISEGGRRRRARKEREMPELPLKVRD